MMLVSTASAAVAPAEEWSETYGRSNPIHKWIPFIRTDANLLEAIRSVQQTTDGGYIIVGQSLGSGDIWLVKVKENGNKQWDKLLDESTQDYAITVTQTIEGGYIIGGHTSVKSTYTDLYLWLIKTDEDGNKLWSKIFNESSNENYAYSIQQTTDGGYIIAAGTINKSDDSNDDYSADPNGFSNMCLIKTDEDGNKQWSKTFGEPYKKYTIPVQQTPDGGYLIQGRGDRGFWFIKTDENGDKQWDKTLNMESSDFSYLIQQTTDGGYIFAGYKKINSDYLLGIVKTDEKGDEQWMTLYDIGGWKEGEAVGMLKSIQQTTDGGYIILGGDHSRYQFTYLLKINQDGKEQWNKTWVNSDDFSLLVWRAYQTYDGGYIISGMADIDGKDDYEY